MEPLGRHVLAELGGCDARILSDLDAVRGAMLQAARDSGATVVTDSFHHFVPLGVSGVVIVSESHLAIHTWPEHGFAAVDYFTCGASVDPGIALDLLASRLGARTREVRELPRGVLREV